MSEIKRPLKVFLYHAPLDKMAVRDLYLRLIKDGVDAWLVKERLLPGQDWKQEIHNAVREADVVIVCVSERFEQGEFRQKEVWLALDAVLEELEDEIFLIPVRLEECDALDWLRKWDRVNLFEEGGYEELMYALQQQAHEIGAAVQSNEGSLPQLHTASTDPPKPAPEWKPVQVMDGTPGILTDGPGILLEGPAVILQRPGSRRKLNRAMIVALMGLAGIVVAFMLNSPRFQRWYQLSLTTLLEPTQTSLPATEKTPVVTPTLKPLPTLTGQGKISHIVFLVDTTGSMQGQRIRNVKSAVSKFVSRLGGNYLVSVIEFNTYVELRMSAMRDHAVASEAIKSITVGVSHNGSCVVDALSAAVQQDPVGPTANDRETMIILLTDVALGENVGWNCGLRLTDDFVTLVWNHPIPIFTIYVGDDFDANYFLRWMISEGATLAANSEKKIDTTLLSIAKAAGLELYPGFITPEPGTRSRQVSMVFVPAGEFIMGNSTVYLDSFWIDKTEVTNAMYAKCVQAGNCSAPRANRSNTRERYFGNPEFDDYPVIYISWLDANNFCTWAGGRLPTEAEWEKAARGMDGRPFPWGDEDPSSVLDLLNYHTQDTAEVGTYPNGASPYGALDMAGNVSEWVADWYSLDSYGNPPASNPLGPDSGEYRVWRGGSWANTSTDRVRTYSRTGNLPTDSSSGIGFRCARDAAP